MQLLKITQPKTGILKICNIVSLCLSFIAFSICLGLYFAHYGFDMGYEIAEKLYSIPVEGVTFSSHGPRTYEGLADMYKYITWILAMSLTSKFLETKLDKILEIEIFFQIICFSLLSLILNQLWWLFAEKDLRSQTMFWDKPYDSLLCNSVPFDWICLFIVLTLMIIQITTAYHHYFDWKRKDIAVK